MIDHTEKLYHFEILREALREIFIAGCRITQIRRRPHHETDFIVRTTDWISPAPAIFRRRLAMVSLITPPGVLVRVS
jgi:hypothetical protein